MALSLATPTFIDRTRRARCIACQVCVRQCANDVHYYDEDDERVRSQRRAVRRLPPLRDPVPHPRAHGAHATRSSSARTPTGRATR